MAENDVVIIDSIDEYNEMIGLETKHPLVAVVDMAEADYQRARGEKTYEYEVYSVWLKETM